MVLTPIRRLRITNKLRYRLALAKRAAEFSQTTKSEIVLLELARAVMRQVTRQERARERLLAQPKPRAVGVVDVRLVPRKQRA